MSVIRRNLTPAEREALDAAYLRACRIRLLVHAVAALIGLAAGAAAWVLR